jgi:hypothetical protein
MTDERRDEPADAPTDLSAAARAIVRDPGDPRIDAHLAALGLGDDPAPRPRVRAGGPAGDAAEVDELRRRIGELEREVDAGRARIRTLSLAVIVAAVAIVILLAIAVVR